MRFITRQNRANQISALERNLKLFVAFLPFPFLSRSSVSHQRLQMKETVCFQLCVPSQVRANVLIFANSSRPAFRKQALRACTGEFCLRESRGRQGTLTDHVRRWNCRLLRPSCHQAHLSGRWPYLRGTTRSSSCWGITRERLPDEAAWSCSPAPHDSVCFWVIIVTGPWWSGEKPQKPEEVFVSYVWGRHASCNKSETGNVYRNFSGDLQKQSECSLLAYCAILLKEFQHFKALHCCHYMHV